MDATSWNRVKDLIADIRTRLTVAERLANTPVVDGEIPVMTPEGDTDDILDEVTEYFTVESEPTQVAEAPPTAAH